MIPTPFVLLVCQSKLVMSCKKCTNEDESLFRMENDMRVMERLINDFARERQLVLMEEMDLATKLEELLNCVNGVWNDRDLMWRQQSKARLIYDEFHEEAIDSDQAVEAMNDALQLVRQDFHVPNYEVILDDFFYETGLKDIGGLFAYVRSKLCEDAEERCMDLADQCPKQ